jgi:signal peptide peptidase SppA
MSKQFPHLLTELFRKPVCITQARHAALVRVLETRMAAPQVIHEDTDTEEPDEAPPRPDWQTFGAGAVIPVHGVLVRHASDIPLSTCGCGLDEVSTMIDLAMADSEVTKLIFDFRTPGGAVTGLPEVAAKIAGITSKQTIAFTDSECCSGGLWLASQCQYFYAAPSADVGSIGVWCACLDMSRQMQNDGVNMQAISAGKYKLLGAYWKPISDEERAMLQAGVDKIFVQFKEAVNLRRQIGVENMEGQIFTGEEAAEKGLVDGLVSELSELLEQDDQED